MYQYSFILVLYRVTKEKNFFFLCFTGRQQRKPTEKMTTILGAYNPSQLGRERRTNPGVLDLSLSQGIKRGAP